MRLYTVVFFGWLLQSTSAFACSCAYVPTFCETITYGSDTISSALLVAHVRIGTKEDESMQVHIQTLYSGKTLSNELTVLKGYGADCRDNIDRFEEGKDYLFAMYGSAETGYILSICGVTSLPILEGEIVGAISPGVDRISLSDFPEIDDCGNLHGQPFSIDVKPTLSSTEIHVETSHDLQDIDITVYDMMGRQVYALQENSLSASQPFVIPAWQFASGCYAVVVHVGTLRRTFKVVITT